jgi:hypothetical protein
MQRALVSSWTPRDLDRRSRRSHRKAAAALLAGTRREEKDAARARRENELAERSAAAFLPANGESGPLALRTHARLRVPPHRATSAALSGAYPFLAEGGLGSEGLVIGRDLYAGGTFCYDPWVFYNRGILSNPNMLVAGVIGQAKSALAKSIAFRSIPFGRKVYVPGDPKGEWGAITRAVGGCELALGHGMTARLNPLDEGPRPADVNDRTWANLVWTRRRELIGTITETVIDRRLLPTEHSALDAALRTAVAESATPVLPRVVDALLNPAMIDALSSGDTAATLRADGRDIGHALRRLVTGDLAGLFDGPSTVAFDTSAPMISVDLSRIGGSDTLLAIVMTCASSWMEAGLVDPSGGKRWVVYDEAWRIMRQLALLRRMQSQQKLARALGIASTMIIHRLSDLDAIGDASSEARALATGLLADCSTRVIYKQESDQVANSSALLGLTDPERDLLPLLRRGVALWRVGQRSFVVQHRRSSAEIVLLDTDSRMTLATE